MTTVLRGYTTKTFVSILLLAMGSAWVGTAHGDLLKCKNGIVATGDSKVKVILNCGDPFYAEVISGDDQVKVEQWYYKLGGGRFIRQLTFRAGKLVRIKKEILIRQPYGG